MEERFFWRENPTYVMKEIHFLRGNPKGIHQRGLSLLKHNYSRWAHSTSNFHVLIGQNLTGEFMRRNLCSILKLVYFDSWSWQSLVSTCDVFSCLFPLGVENEIQLLSRLFCHSWLVCPLFLSWEMCRLSKSEIRWRMAFFVSNFM